MSRPDSAGNRLQQQMAQSIVSTHERLGSESFSEILKFECHVEFRRKVAEKGSNLTFQRVYGWFRVIAVWLGCDLDLAAIATAATKAWVDEQKRRVEVDTVFSRPLDHRKVLVPPAAVAFDPNALSIIGDATQRAPFPGIIFRKLVPARWLTRSLCRAWPVILAVPRGEANARRQ